MSVVYTKSSFCRRFTGVEFAVVHAQPPTFFIIQKRERLSPEEGALLGLLLSSQLTHLSDTAVGVFYH